MINPNELRIGNLVYCNTAKLVVKVQWPHPAHLVVDIKGPFVHCDHTDGDLEEFDPIPLTPEWLQRCGLEKRYWNTDKDLKLEIYENKAYIGNNFSTSASIVHNINYVHQLQNLYFALTGEDLIIKETV